MYKRLFRQEAIRILFKVYSHIPERRKKLLFFIFVLIIISGFLDLLNIASLLPVLSYFSSPDNLSELKIYDFIFNVFYIEDHKYKLLITTIMFIFLVILSNLSKIFTLFLNSRIAALAGSDLSFAVYRNNLCQSYADHLKKNSSDILSNLVTGSQIIVGVLNNYLRLIYSFFNFIFVFFALLIIDAKIAFSSLFIFTIIYLLIMLYFKKTLKVKSGKIYSNNVSIVKMVRESFGNIRDIILDNSYKFYLSDYKKKDSLLRKKQAEIELLGNVPYSFIEALALIIVVLIGLFLSLYQSNSNTLAILGTIGLGLQRLLRSVQSIYSSWVFIQGRITPISKYLDYLDLNVNSQFFENNKRKLDLKESISLRNISFKYKDKYIFENLNIQIKKGNKIGITGKTGCGKSTLINIIMGLLEPTKGNIIVDSTDINKNEKIKLEYFNSIAHVPQDIYIANSSFAENIAFGVPSKDIDFEKLEKVAKKAFIFDLIQSTENSFMTEVGERGINLSGGQKQRLGIARALYKDSSILILDEATSALDYYTENLVINSIQEYKNKLTIIMIAHRLKTLDKCDFVINL